MRDDEPGLDVELLAQLDAGALAPDQAARVRAAAATDPAATATLAALAATRAELAALPLPAPPPGAVPRWVAAVQALADAGVRPAPPADSSRVAAAVPAPVPSDGSPSDRTPADANSGDATPADGTPRDTAAEASTTPRATPGVEARSRPRNPLVSAQPCSSTAEHSRARSALVLAAGLLLLVLLPLLPPAEPGRIDGVDLAAAGRSAVGSSDLGALGDPRRRAGCLRAAGVLGLDPDAVPLGGRRVDLARGPAILLVFATGELGVFDVVVVDPDCGPTGGTLLGTARIGR